MSRKIQTRRKLQFAGNSSYVLTLPKDWIRAQNLDNKASEVNIEELSDSSLRISLANLGENAEKESPFYINILENSDPEEVVRLILGAYLSSKPNINLKTREIDIIPVEITMKINNLIGKLWGSEITAETSTEIVIQDALDPASMGISECIDRAWFTAKNMLALSFKAIFEVNEDAKINVENSENTLDKLYYLALRQLYKASSNYIFASNIGIKPKDIIDFHLLAKNIERIGDHCVQLDSNFGKEFKNVEELKNLAYMIQESTDHAINAFQKRDEEDAQWAINRKSHVINTASEIDFTYNELPLARSILRIADYSSDIGELVINRIVSETD